MNQGAREAAWTSWTVSYSRHRTVADEVLKRRIAGFKIDATSGMVEHSQCLLQDLVNLDGIFRNGTWFSQYSLYQLRTLVAYRH